MAMRFIPATGASIAPQIAGGAMILVDPALVDLAAGDFVNVVNSGGVLKAQPANATDASKPADGFVSWAVAAGATAEVRGSGCVNTHLSGLTAGADYFLATANGQITTTAPSASGNLVLPVGNALSATALMFSPQIGVRRR